MASNWRVSQACDDCPVCWNEEECLLGCGCGGHNLHCGIVDGALWYKEYRGCWCWDSQQQVKCSLWGCDTSDLTPYWQGGGGEEQQVARELGLVPHRQDVAHHQVLAPHLLQSAAPHDQHLGVVDGLVVKVTQEVLIALSRVVIEE